MNPSNIKERDDWYILSHNQQRCCPLLSKRNHLRQVTRTSGWGHCKPKRCLQLTMPPKTPLPGSIQRFLWEPDLSASRPPGSAGFMNHEAHFDGCFEMVHVCAICLTDQHGRATNDQKKVWTGFNKVTSYNYCHFAPLHGHGQARSRWKCPSETRPTPWHHTQPSKCYTRQAACITIWWMFNIPWKPEETRDASLDQIQTHPWASGGMFSLAIGQHTFQLPNRVQKVPSPLHRFGISHPVSPQHIIPNKLPIRPWPYSSIFDYPLQTGWTNLPFRTFHCKRHTQIVCNFMPSLGCQLLLARTDPCCETHARFCRCKSTSVPTTVQYYNLEGASHSTKPKPANIKPSLRTQVKWSCRMSFIFSYHNPILG